MSDTPPPITSPANERIKSIARLRGRAERESTGRTIVDGAREVGRALAARADLEQAFVAPTLVRTAEAAETLESLAASGIPIVNVSESAFARIAYGDRSDGILAIVRVPPSTLDRLLLPTDSLLVVLEGIEKPGNLGAVLRSADGAGADALIAADPLTDVWNPNAIRASMGTIFSTPIATAGSAETLAWLRSRGLRVVAARVDAAAPYDRVDLTGPLALVLGSEASGLTDVWGERDIVGARIPMLGRADSLNVSVAAAILLFEARRQRAL
jgi:RNA methyltransferase, TrmH family